MIFWNCLGRLYAEPAARETNAGEWPAPAHERMAACAWVRHDASHDGDRDGQDWPRIRWDQSAPGSRARRIRAQVCGVEALVLSRRRDVHQRAGGRYAPTNSRTAVSCTDQSRSKLESSRLAHLRLLSLGTIEHEGLSEQELLQGQKAWPGKRSPPRHRWRWRRSFCIGCTVCISIGVGVAVTVAVGFGFGCARGRKVGKWGEVGGTTRQRP